jgi:hypothetical protein
MNEPEGEVTNHKDGDECALVNLDEETRRKLTEIMEGERTVPSEGTAEEAVVTHTVSNTWKTYRALTEKTGRSNEGIHLRIHSGRLDERGKYEQETQQLWEDHIDWMRERVLRLVNKAGEKKLTQKERSIRHIPRGEEKRFKTSYREKDSQLIVLEKIPTGGSEDGDQTDEYLSETAGREEKEDMN